MNANATLDRPDQNEDLTPSRKQCVACREFIQPDAKICPHCHSSQYKSRLKKAGDLLKWIGGIAAIVSLVIGMSRINNIFQNWRERNEAVSELVQAAEMQKETGDYPGAWRLLDEALKLELGSKLAREKQVRLAMIWLRNVRTEGSASFKDIVDKLLPALYRGATSANERTAADVFAHLGWANYLQHREGMTWLDVDAQFQRALELDPENVYAHVMWGYWMLWPGNRQKYEDSNLNSAREHFATALKSGQQRAFIRNMQFNGLFNASGVDVGVASGVDLGGDGINIKNEIRKQHETIKYAHRYRVIKTYTDLLYTSDYAQELSRKLMAALPPKDLLETFRWLTTAQDTRAKLTANQTESYKFLNAYFTEKAGDLQQALSMYKSLKNELRPNSAFHARVDQAVERISRE
jgi:hypothetical protein